MLMTEAGVVVEEAKGAEKNIPHSSIVFFFKDDDFFGEFLYRLRDGNIICFQRKKNRLLTNKYFRLLLMLLLASSSSSSSVSISFLFSFSSPSHLEFFDDCIKTTTNNSL
jgi:hypothetical protein